VQVYNFTPSGQWQEDKGWVQQLDVGWRVDAVRDAAYAALAQVGDRRIGSRLFAFGGVSSGRVLGQR
jgi:hypothetical protein